MNYNVFRIPKKHGKFRTIEEPCPELKARQNDTLRELEITLLISEYAHAFVQGRSIVSMAEPHINKEYVACCDITDFFPSIKADNLIRLTSRVTRLNVDVATNDFGDGKGQRLPQGAPTSPILSNAYLYHLDIYIGNEARRLGCSYTRYADDLVFSGSTREKMEELLKISKFTLEEEFLLEINIKKTKIMHRTQRQTVCGIVVNEKLNVARDRRKRLRAEIHQQRGSVKLSRSTIGKRAFENMVRRRGHV